MSVRSDLLHSDKLGVVLLWLVVTGKNIQGLLIPWQREREARSVMVRKGQRAKSLKCIGA